MATADQETSGAPANSGQERRRSARQALVTRAMIYPDGMPGAPRRILLSDVSMLGVAFDSAAAVEPGQRYRLRIEAGPMRMSSRLRVVSCRQHEDYTYAVGAEFVSNELEVAGPVSERPRIELHPRNPSYDLIPRA